MPEGGHKKRHLRHALFVQSGQRDVLFSLSEHQKQGMSTKIEYKLELEQRKIFLYQLSN